MSATETHLINLPYGKEDRFSCEVAADKVVGYQTGPRATARVQEKLLAALRSPIDLPSLKKCILPDDHIAIALEPYTPCVTDLIAAIWMTLKECGISAENIVIVQPILPHSKTLPEDPRSGLAGDVRETVNWKLYEPAEQEHCVYVATTSSGERIYLAREIVDADFVMTVGQIAFDSVMGFSGTNSVFYPGLSTADVFEKSLGQGHLELGPNDIRPQRQKVDEIGWLLGTQFSIQVISAAKGGVYHILAGSMDSVLRQGRKLLSQHWLINQPERRDTLVLAIDEETTTGGWERIGAALATARRLVAKEGRILLLTAHAELPTQGITLLQQAESPADALKLLRAELPVNVVAATQIAQAAEWAQIYLLSNLKNDIAEDLFFTPMENNADVARLLAYSDSCLFLGSAQHTFGVIESNE